MINKSHFLIGLQTAVIILITYGADRIVSSGKLNNIGNFSVWAAMAVIQCAIALNIIEKVR